MSNATKDWEEYVEREQERVTPLLAALGITLDAHQPQTIGERYLTRPRDGGRKVVFFGTRQSDNARFVVKTSSEPRGVAELAHERQVYAMLIRIRFAYGVFALPALLRFDERNGLLITEFIEQERPFLDRPLCEQFSIALDAFKAQENAHATTSEHWNALKNMMRTNEYYIKPGEYGKMGAYAQDLTLIKGYDDGLYARLDPLLNRALDLVRNNEAVLEQYSGFLTHWDFIPQNFRIRDHKLFLLDLTALRFGNKYEGWARFINFMELYNPALARALTSYVRLNRVPEELVALKAMRAYRLIELIRYYATLLSKTEGDTRLLAETRIVFWSEVLSHVLNDTDVPREIVEAYKAKRDSLRSEDEKRRQIGLH